MPLPNVNTPTYETTLPLSKKKIKYRGFLVGEEKAAILALTESDEDARNLAFIKSSVEIAQNCILTEDVKIMDMYTADFEHLFIQLRKISKSNVVDLNIPCQSCKENMKISYNLDDVRLTDNPSTKIKLTDSIGIELTFPKVKDTINSMDENNQISKSQMLYDNIKHIWENDVVYDSFSQAELDHWVDNLDRGMITKINEFFNNIPAIVADIDWKCPHCEHENKLPVKGIPRFFG